MQQTLVENAKRIAQEYPEEYRDTYTEAAETLRAPFWDWAADNTVPPDTVPATIIVNVPDGQSLKSETIDNPLYTYKFPQAVLNGEFGYFDNQYRSQVYHCSAPNSYPASANRRMANGNYRHWTVSLVLGLSRIAPKLTRKLSTMFSPNQEALPRSQPFRTEA